MYAVTRSLIRSHGLRQGIDMVQASQVRQATMKVVPVAESIKNETWTEKNERLGRALSPHLSIYKPQLTSILSVMHRGTGMVLATGAYAVGLGALISSQDVSHYITMVEGLQLSAATLMAAKFCIAYPLGYHAANGVRHLLWDTGRFLKIKEVYTTGYAMVAASFIITAILAML